MLHDDMTLATFIVYAQSIEESKHRWMTRNLKRSGSSDQDQLRSKRRAQTQKEPRSSKVKIWRGGGSENGKPTCITCGKRHYRKCLTNVSFVVGRIFIS